MQNAEEIILWAMKDKELGIDGARRGF